MSTTTFGCRSCGATSLISILNLGETPLANALLSADQLNQAEPCYPLKLVFCQACTLIQITETVPPDRLFSDYIYLSSFSDTMLRHAETLVNETVSQRQLNSQSAVVEIASNDGYLLQFYQRAGIPVLGIEPAANIAAVANQRGIATISDFFGNSLAQKLRAEGRQADVIHAHNVLAHVADLNGFVSGLHAMLKNDGIAIIEVPYVRDLVERCEFDTIYHEHLCYFSLTSLERLFRRQQLEIADVAHLGIHGGTLRITVAKTSAGSRRQAATVSNFLAAETEWGVAETETYLTLSKKVQQLRAELLSVLNEEKSKGRRLAAYGAAAKGSTLLNYFQLGTETLDFVVDRSPLKQGKFMPGSHLPILAPEKLLELMPDCVLLLTWNLANEILAQQSEYRSRGGRFLIPIPRVRLIEPNEALQTESISA